jgi:hypothetical protein
MRVVACLGVAAVVLSGCTEKQEASTALPASSAPAETTPELPPLGPEDMPMPDEARTRDAAGAEAFVRYYIELINRTSTVMDAQPLRDLSKNCEECTRIATSTEKAARAGEDYEGGKVTITELTEPLMTDDRAGMAVRIDQEALRVLDASDSPMAKRGSEAYAGIPGSAAAQWDPLMQSWVMTSLRFGAP